MAGLVLAACALACPVSMGAMMLMMRRRHGDGASRSEIGDSGSRNPGAAATAALKEEPDGSQE